MQRYHEIVDEPGVLERFEGEQPLTAVRRNSLKAGPGFEERLGQSFPEMERSPWNPEVFRLPGAEKPGKTEMHWLGEYYAQEESASLPVEVLDPQPGEKILDLCAAPGGKTTQIASKIDNRGTLVANDVRGSRMKSLHANVYRCGAACVQAVNYDGRHIPSSGFDRVLVDAPCTGEGDRLRRGAGPVDREESRSMAELQFDLLKRGSELLEEGGALVYSTCTVSPLENEAVVSRAIQELDLALEEVETDCPHLRGIPSFEGESYGDAVERTVRVLPHHLDSGVIYVARFRKGREVP
jgi:NOL1/NOP2/sun family putative RNA methylase